MLKKKKKKAMFNFVGAMTLSLLLISAYRSQFVSKISISPLLDEYSIFGSVHGGTTLYFRGTDFDNIGFKNEVFIGIHPCPVSTYAITKTYMSCTIPEKYYGELLDQEVVVRVKGLVFPIKWGDKLFSFLDYYSPYVSYIYPQSTFAGERLNVYGVHRTTGVSSLTSMRISGQNCEFDEEELEDVGGLSRWSYKTLFCKIPEDLPSGDHTIVLKGQQGTGTSKLITSALGHAVGTTTDSYALRIHPKIESVEPKDGYMNGQLLTLKGKGFGDKADELDIKIEGTACKVQTVKDSELTCKLAKTSTEPTKGVYFGNAGLMLQHFDLNISIDNLLKSYTDRSFDINDAHTEFPKDDPKNKVKVSSILSMEDVPNGYHYLKRMFGVFHATATGKFKFYSASDDDSRLYISKLKIDDSKPFDDTVEMTQLLTIGWTGIRNYYRDNMSQVKEVTLEKDANYYMIYLHREGNGSDYFTLSVEVPNSNASLKPQVPHVQELKVNNTPIREVMEVKVYRADSGTYTIVFPQEREIEVGGVKQKNVFNDLISNPIAWDASDIVFRDAIRLKMGWNMTVVRQAINNSGSDTSVEADIKGYKYTITFNYFKGVTQAPYIDMKKLSSGARSSGKILTPPSDPVRGTFKLSYNGEDTRDLAYNEWEGWMQYYLTGLTSLKDGVTVFEEGNTDDGKLWRIVTNGITGSAQNFSVKDVKLTGGTSGKPSMSVNTNYRPASTNLFYQPIPSDFLSTIHKKPQLILKKGEVRAGCPSQTCDYNFVADDKTPTISSFTVTENPVTLTLKAGFESLVESALISKPENYTINFGNSSCSNVTVADSNITCTLPTNSDGSLKFEAGSNKPEVLLKDKGYYIIEPVAVVSTPKITAVTPNVGSTAGGTLLTITGTLFPSSKDNATVKVGNQVCDIQTISSESITCLTSASAGSGTEKLSVTVNAQTWTDVANPPVFKYSGTDTPEITSMSMNTASPILKQDLEINGSKFGTNRDMITVTLKPVDPSGGLYDLECFTFDTEITDNKIICRLGGGKSGAYKVMVTLKGKGFAQVEPANANDFKYEMTITGLDYSSGSLEGGHLITISGTNFSKKKTDNNVIIGENKDLCFVEDSSETEIKCRTRKPKEVLTGDQTVYMFGKITEEAVCKGSCVYQFKDTKTPKITSITPDKAKAGDTITINGSAFSPLDSGKLEIIYGNVKVTNIVSSTNTKIEFEMPGTDLLQGEVYVYSEGKGKAQNPSSATVFTLANELAVKEVLPKLGSGGGHKITISGSRFGNKKNTSVKVGNQDCFIETITFTQITCWFLHLGGGPGSSKDIIVTVISGEGSDEIKTQTEVCAKCQFTSNAGEQPWIETLTNSKLSNAAIVTFIASGKQLNSNAGTANAYLFASDQVKYPMLYKLGSVSAITNTEQVDVSFTNVSAGNYTLAYYIPNLGFAQRENPAKNIIVPYSGISVTGNATNSFNGGGEFSIQGKGFLPDAFKDNYTVTICNRKCSIISSSFALLKCRVPIFNSKDVEARWKLGKDEVLKDLRIFNEHSANEPNVTNDGLFNTYYSGDETAYIGYDIGEGLIGDLSSVKIFPALGKDEHNLITAVFQGADKIDSEADWKDLFVMGETVVENWNEYKPKDGADWKYRYFRIKCKYCQIAEFHLIGKVLNNVNNVNLASHSCPVKIVENEKTIADISNGATYGNSAVSEVTSVSPEIISIVGGETVTITGTNLDTSGKIMIDGIQCIVKAGSSATSLQCTTGARPLYTEPNLVVTSSTGGDAITNGKKFYYAERWSKTATWGGESLPRIGDLVHIPKGQTLLLDVSTPHLASIVVEGVLIFEDKTDLVVDSDFIIVNNGALQIGTPEKRHENKVTITLHGSRTSTQFPGFGNKTIMVQGGSIDIHGKERTPTWTFLDVSADAGSSTIVLIVVVDWAEGEKIVIAPTSFDRDEVEERTIVKVTIANGKSTIELDKPLEFGHYAGNITIDSVTTQIRGEVGLLSRNIVIKGDDNSVKDQYGVHIMIRGEEGLVFGRFSYIEVFHAGQAFQMGRYPIHFHMIGNVIGSSIIGCSVHHTFNRATTIHGVFYLRILKNVYYRHMGHAIFVEDSIESKNVVEDNLIIHVTKSTSLLESDLKPAGIWITFPDNFFRRNSSIGSTHFGYWFDLVAHPTGPSNTDTICPIGTPLGAFDDNIGHSNGIGLRIYPRFKPRTFPCNPVKNPSLVDEFEMNEPVPAIFKRNLMYSNASGIFHRDFGAIQHDDLRLFHNWTHISYAEPFYSRDSQAKIENSLVVGVSDINTYHKNPNGLGIHTGRKDGFLIKDTKFYNFSDGRFIFTCSGCGAESHRDIGGRRVTFENVTFTAVTNPKIVFRDADLDKDIFYDKTGSFITLLTGLSSTGGWVTPWFEHLNIPECKKYEEPVCSPACAVCDNTITIQRLELVVKDNKSMVEGFEIKIMNLNVSGESFTPVLKDETKFGKYTWRNVFKTEGFEGYTFIVATKYNYNLHFGTGIDWTKIEIHNNFYWTTTNQGVNLRFNNTDTRELYKFKRKQTVTKEELSTLLPEQILLDADVEILNADPTSADTFGDFYYEGEKKLLNVRVDGKKRGFTELTAVFCEKTCPESSNKNVIEKRERLWDVAGDWKKDGDNTPAGVVPIEGADVIIENTWNMIVNVDTASLKSLKVLGHLSFRNEYDTATLKSKVIEIDEYGKLYAGTSESPFTKKAKILLTGTTEDETVQVGPSIPPMTKAIIVKGKLELFGDRPKTVWTHLRESAAVDATTIKVVPGSKGLSWKVGDKLVISSSSINSADVDHVTIKSVTEAGTITLETKLKYFHYGNATPKTLPNSKTLDMRAEVGLLNRNIVIEGSDESNFGCSVLVPYYKPIGASPWEFIQGTLNVDSVQFNKCGQRDTDKAAVNIRQTLKEKGTQSVMFSSFTDSEGWAINMSNAEGITISDNVISNSRRFGIYLSGCKFVVITKNLIVGVRKRDNFNSKELIDMIIGVYYNDTNGLGLETISNVITSNRVSSADFSFVVPGYSCDSEKEKPNFADNVGHSSDAGWFAYELNNGLTCQKFSHFSAFKNRSEGFVNRQDGAKIIVSDMVLADNYNSIAVNGGVPTLNTWFSKVNMSDLIIYGRALPECEDCYKGVGNCEHHGMYSSLFNEDKYRFYFEDERLPLHNSTSAEYNIAGKHIIENIHFENFQESYTCDKKSKAFRLNNFYQDGTVSIWASKLTLTNVDDNSKFYFDNHKRHLNTVAFCGKRDCTGIYNTPIYDTDGSFFDKPMNFFGNNKGAGRDGDCTFFDTWNGHSCNPKYAQLNFLQPTRDRSPIISPITISILNYDDDRTDETKVKFEIDSKNKFSALVKTGKEHVIGYAATMPDGMKYKLTSATPSEYIMIRVHSENPAPLYLEKNGKKIKNQIVRENEPYSFEGKLTCGTNFYLSKKSIMIFLITGEDDCIIEVKNSNAIALNARMDISVADFYKDDGVTKFIDRVAASLGISQDRIRIVGVYTGSTNVDFIISASGNINEEGHTKESDTTELNTLLKTFKTNVESGTLDLGAPVLELTAELALDNTPDEVIGGGSGTTPVDPTLQEEEAAKIRNRNIGLGVGIPLAILFILAVTYAVYYFTCKKAKAAKNSQYTQKESQTMSREGANIEYNKPEYKPNNMDFSKKKNAPIKKINKLHK